MLEPEYKHRLGEKGLRCNNFAISMLTKAGTLRSGGLFGRQMKEKAKKRRADFFGLAEVQLTPNSGVIQQTGLNPNHYDLWPYVSSNLERNVISVKEI